MEWRRAAARAQRAPFHIPYIFPLIIDDTSVEAARQHVPEAFLPAQWTIGVGGVLTDEFLNRIKDAYRKLQEPETTSA
jgi:hypothetical protein